MEERECSTAIVLAAGRGSRMKSEVQKQYLQIGGKPVLYYSLKAFQDYAGITQIILVTGENEIEYCKENIVDRYALNKVSKIVPGGKERYHSVYEGLKAAGECSFVLIHDGARPFIDSEMLDRLMKAVRIHQACVAGMPVKDTIKISDEKQFAEATPDRSRLWMIQTPQVFRYNLIKGSYDRLMQTKAAGVTDDAMVVEQFGEYPVKLVEGSYRNIKITTPEDLVIAGAFLR